MSKIRMEWDFRFICLLAFAFPYVLFSASSHHDRTFSAYFYILHARHAIVLGRWSHHARATAINAPWFNLSTPITICDMQIKFWHIFSWYVCVRVSIFLLVLRCFTCEFTLSIRNKAHSSVHGMCVCAWQIEWCNRSLIWPVVATNAFEQLQQQWKSQYYSFKHTSFNLYYICFIFVWIHFSVAQQINAFSSTNEPTVRPIVACRASLLFFCDDFLSIHLDRIKCILWTQQHTYSRLVL